MNPDLSVIPTTFGKNDSPDTRAKKFNQLLGIIAKKAKGKKLMLFLVSSDDEDQRRYCMELANKLCGDHQVEYAAHDFFWRQSDKARGVRTALGFTANTYGPLADILILVVPTDHEEVMLNLVQKDASYSIEFISTEKSPDPTDKNILH